MCSLQLNSSGLRSLSVNHTTFTHNPAKKFKTLTKPSKQFVRFPKRNNIRAVSTVPDSQSAAAKEEEEEILEPASVDFAFVHSVLLPDGTPDVHFRTAGGGQKLRDVMLDSNIDLYGPYAKPLSNCGGGGTCATCMVEIVDGKELLNPRTDKEKEKLKRKPKNWRLACQTIVGKPDSRGMVVVQQLPEWKAHEWKLEKDLPSDETS